MSGANRQAVADILKEATARLREGQIESPRLDAGLLLCDALNISREALIREPDRVVTEAELEIFQASLGRRLAREPVSKILGHREFWSLTFAVNKDVLDPRPDSETLVAAVLERVDRDRPLRILDLGTGSGCLLLSLLHELPLAEGVGVDRSEKALGVAAENARALGLAGRCQFRRGNWFSGLSGRFDIIISNPPYIAEDERAGLSDEVRLYDPEEALFAGEDGLSAYREITARAGDFLLPGGCLVLELGVKQASAVTDMLTNAGMNDIEVVKDISGIQRCLIGRRGSPVPQRKNKTG